VNRSLVIKNNVEGVIPAGSEKLDVLQGLAFGFFKTMKTPAIIAPDRGLSALGFGVTQGGREFV